MKALFTTSLLALVVSASAQITLNQSSYTGWQPRPENANSLDASMPYPSLMPATNASWVLTNYTYDPNNARLYTKGAFTSPAFPNATFFDTVSYPLSASLSYGVQEAGAITASGIQYYGQKIPRQAFSVAAISGGANDSIVFPAQNSVYSSLRTAVKFPATMGSSWGSDYRFSTDFNITIAAYNLNNTPSQRRTYITHTDTVKGWGKMTVKDGNGVTTAPMDVLMTKVTARQTDSFFLNGLPAPVQLLSAFGLSQGQITERYFYYFYRTGEVMPLLTAAYRSNSFSSTDVDYIDVHGDRLTYLSVLNVASENGVKVYPNPVADQTLYLELTDPTVSTLQYTLMNINGQAVSKGTLAPQNGRAKLNAAALGAPGVYYLQLSNGNSSYATVSLLVK